MIRKTVEQIINKHNTNDPYLICRDMGVTIIQAPLVKVNGFYHRFEDHDFIYLNDNLNENEARLVLAHELGHVILHSDINALYLETYNQCTNRYEVEANAFAILLLKDQLNLNSEILLLDWRYGNEKLISLVS